MTLTYQHIKGQTSIPYQRRVEKFVRVEIYSRLLSYRNNDNLLICSLLVAGVFLLGYRKVYCILLAKTLQHYYNTVLVNLIPSV